MADKEWEVLVALETLIDALPDFPEVSIGMVEDMFHKNKFKGKLPAVFLEWRGNAESGPEDSSAERYVPFTVTVVILFRAESVEEQRRARIQTAIQYKNILVNAIDGDPQLGAKQVVLSPVGETRVLAMSERVPSPYWVVEIDLPCATWQSKAGRV